MLILLPPSEGKSAPRRGAGFDPAALSNPELAEPRAAVLEALVNLCREGDEATALKTLGLTAGQAGYLSSNAALESAPAARADRIYSGVLYDALDLASLEGSAKARATRWIGIASALFGLVRPTDRIPAYRLAGNVSLPGIGGVAAHWRRHLGSAIDPHQGLILDLRSSTYAGFWKPDARTTSIRVLHEVNGKRSVVSHFNKATKGRIVRDLLTDGSSPRSAAELREHLNGLGWRVEANDSGLDVVVAEIH